MSTEKIFANGFVFKKQENAPEWVIGSLACKAEEAMIFLKEHMKQDGWVNMSIKVSLAGKPYIELDTWEPKKKEDTKVKEPVESFEDEEGEDLPF